MNDDEPKTKGEIGEHILRLIEETHANTRLGLHMIGDIYNLVVYGRKPLSPVIPPNPKSVPMKGKFDGSSAADIMDSLGNLLGKLPKFRKR